MSIVCANAANEAYRLEEEGLMPKLRMTVGFTDTYVSRVQIREAQKAFLQGSANKEQRALIDACLSWLINMENERK